MTQICFYCLNQGALRSFPDLYGETAERHAKQHGMPFRAATRAESVADESARRERWITDGAGGLRTPFEAFADGLDLGQ